MKISSNELNRAGIAKVQSVRAFYAKLLEFNPHGRNAPMLSAFIHDLVDVESVLLGVSTASTEKIREVSLNQLGLFDNIN